MADTPRPADPIQSLIRRAFCQGPAVEANTLIYRVRLQVFDRVGDAGAGGDPFRVVDYEGDVQTLLVELGHVVEVAVLADQLAVVADDD